MQWEPQSWCHSCYHNTRGNLLPKLDSTSHNHACRTSKTLLICFYSKPYNLGCIHSSKNLESKQASIHSEISLFWPRFVIQHYLFVARCYLFRVLKRPRQAWWWSGIKNWHWAVGCSGNYRRQNNWYPENIRKGTNVQDFKRGTPLENEDMPTSTAQHWHKQAL